MNLNEEKIHQLFLSNEIKKIKSEINQETKYIEEVYTSNSEENLNLLKQKILDKYPYNPYFTQCLVYELHDDDIIDHNLQLIYTGSTTSD